MGDWGIWLILTGRGWGKTRSGVEFVRDLVENREYRLIHLVAATAADARDVMVEGPAGLVECSPPWFKPKYEPSKRRLTWPNGAVALMFSADQPERLRGPQCEAFWADELCSWRFMAPAWSNLQFGARLGRDVRGIVTTTPRPVLLLKQLLKRQDVHVTRGSLEENVDNLAPLFVQAMLSEFGGTRLGRQEIQGELLDDNPDALWKRSWFDEYRINEIPKGVSLVRVVVAIDPSATSTGDEAGVVVVGRGSDGRLYVLHDGSLQGAPWTWAKKAVALYQEFKADAIVYEGNTGGEMVRQTLRSVIEVDPELDVRAIRIEKVTATRNKQTRAEPIATLYEGGHVSHLGHFAKLEDQCCEWSPDNKSSPDRLDALVWGLTKLHKKQPGSAQMHQT